MEDDEIKISPVTKKCIKCHRVLPIEEFGEDSRSHDGHLRKCKECSAKFTNGNPKLKDFSARELIDELKVRGYTGKLIFTQKREVIV